MDTDLDLEVLQPPCSNRFIRLEVWKESGLLVVAEAFQYKLWFFYNQRQAFQLIVNYMESWFKAANDRSVCKKVADEAIAAVEGFNPSGRLNLDRIEISGHAAAEIGLTYERYARLPVPDDVPNPFAQCFGPTKASQLGLEVPSGAISWRFGPYVGFDSFFSKEQANVFLENLPQPIVMMIGQGVQGLLLPNSVDEDVPCKSVCYEPALEIARWLSAIPAE